MIERPRSRACYPKRPTRTQGAPSMKEIEKVMAKKMFSSEM
jgi:hypothetical protein